MPKSELSKCYKALQVEGPHSQLSCPTKTSVLRNVQTQMRNEARPLGNPVIHALLYILKKNCLKTIKNLNSNSKMMHHQ